MVATVPAIRVVNACKTWGAAAPALQGVSFEVQAGERVALLGASGSGKSTLLRALCALETLDGASSLIEIGGRVLQRDGRVARDVRALRRHVGIVFQQFNLVGRLPVLDNVLTGLAAELPLWRALAGRYPLPHRVRAMQALAAVDMAEHAFRRAATLSGGQQQRAAIARTLVQGASLLLADEPVASLDPASTQRVMELLTALNRDQGLTLLVSLHDVELARRWCTRVLALRRGRLVFDGAASALTPRLLHVLYGSGVSEVMGGGDTQPGVWPESVLQAAA